MVEPAIVDFIGGLLSKAKNMHFLVQTAVSKVEPFIMFYDRQFLCKFLEVFI
jgi:hypothetical protein